MKADLTKIKIIAWDLDGTLFQSQKDLSIAMAGAFVKILSESKNLNEDDARKLLSESVAIHKGVTKSLEALGCGDRISIIKRVESIVDKASYLKVDQKLQKMFTDLSNYKHAIASDTSHTIINKELEALGLSSSIFESITGVDDAKTTKPDRMFYQVMLNKGNYNPSDYLVVGDRVAIDLIPAKELGMMTCLVWSNEVDPERSRRADFVLPTVYNVADLFKE
ncbi:HAD family hydrolase [Candidatus Gottesmanbacteria bacterium]|nr:HAD family hydrolase [Candidatus Gottesmanbacteria bacterium]